MAVKREDVDLELVLQNPNSARNWIKNYEWDILPAPEYIVYGIEEKLYLDNLTDEEAVFAAHVILRDVEIPRVRRALNLLDPEKSVH